MHSTCIERKFQTAENKSYEKKAIIRKVADKRVSSTNKRLINQRGGLLLPLKSADLPTLANLLFRKRDN